MDHNLNQKVKDSNPLKQYFRSFKLYLKLPSGTSYYGPQIVEFTESGEVGILPMTGNDELILKNPDALLNGEALVEVIKSCVPAVKDVKLLLINDIDALITAIRLATYDDGLESQITCPKCNHENTFKLNLQYAIDNIDMLESEYVINLSSGLTVFVKPYCYPELMKGLHSQFEQSKITRSLESNNATDEEKMRIFGKVFKDMAALSVEMVSASIVKVVDESSDVCVTDKKHIREFIQNIDRASITQIEDLVKEINTVGIKRSFGAECEKCNHKWESEIDFNPVNFS